MIRRHRADRAALTLSYQRIERRYVHLFGMVEFDDTGSLTKFVEKPAEPTSDLIFAAFCVFDAAILHRYLEMLDGTSWQHDVSRDVIPAMLRAGERILGYEVEGYWEDIGTVDRFHLAHRGLVRERPTMPIDQLPRTVRPEIPVRRVGYADGVVSSLLAADVASDGFIEDSTAFAGVRVGRDAVVRDCVLLPGAHVPDGARLESAIILEDGTVQQMSPIASAPEAVR